MHRIIDLSEKYFKYIQILLFVSVFIIVINSPIVLAKDSAGYLNMAIFRSPIYPLYLSLIKFLFGSYFSIATIITQFLIGALSIYFLVRTLKTEFKLQNLWYLILTIILLIPYIYNQRVANFFLSEALSYPLYLICVSLFIKSFLSEKTKPLISALPLLIILLLTRSQFLFLVPVGIIILLFICVKNKKLSNLGIFVGFLILPFITTLLDKTYHKVAHNKFVSTPWTGIHLITPAFYVADVEDYSIYDSKKEQDLFKDVYSVLQSKHLNINNLSNDNTDEIAIYVKEYSEIANHTVLVSGQKFTSNNLSNDEKIIVVDLLTKDMATPLIKDNFKKWFVLNIKNFIYGFGNAKYTLLIIIILLYSLYQVLKNKSKVYKLIFLVVLLLISNMALISIGMHTIKRFTFYNDWVLFLVIFIFLNYSQNSIKKSL